MDRWTAITIIILLFLIGFFQILKKKRIIERKRQFASEFLEEFGKYVRARGEDQRIYSWLIQKSPKMQTELGFIGIMHTYRPPHTDDKYYDFPVVINILPEIHKNFETAYLTHQNTKLIQRYEALVSETILRYIGVLDEKLELLQKHFRNPFIWLREGTKLVLIFPLNFLCWFGLIDETKLQDVADNTKFNIFSNLVALLNFLSMIITIITGWDPFYKIAVDFFRNF